MKVYDFPIDKIIASRFKSTQHESITGKNILRVSDNVIPLSLGSDYFVADYLFYLIENYLTNKELVHRDEKDIRYDGILQYRAKQSFKNKLRKVSSTPGEMREIDYALTEISVRNFSSYYDENMYLDFITNTTIEITYRGVKCSVSPTLDGLTNYSRLHSSNVIPLNPEMLDGTLFSVIRAHDKQKQLNISALLTDSIAIGDLQALEKLPSLGLSSNFTDIIDPNPVIPTEPNRPDSDYRLITAANIQDFTLNTNILRGVYV